MLRLNAEKQFYLITTFLFEIFLQSLKILKQQILTLAWFFRNQFFLNSRRELRS